VRGREEESSSKELPQSINVKLSSKEAFIYGDGGELSPPSNP
jgi:hypothetical protein